jgi:hypothetical protein
MKMSTQQGAALLVVMMLAGLVAAATLALVKTTGTDVAVVGTFVWGWQAQYAAETGIHRAIVDLRRLPDWTTVLDGTTVSSFADGSPDAARSIGGRLVDIRRLQSLATCGRLTPCTDDDRTATTAERPWGDNNPNWHPFAFGPIATLAASAGLPAANPAFVVVLVADDPAESDGNAGRDEDEGRPGGGVVRLRAYGFSSGGARRTVEAVVARAPGGGRVRVLRWQNE